MNIPKNNLNSQNVSFSGHSKKLDKTGYVVQHFYYMYDPEKYNCELELYSLLRDANGNMQVTTPNKPQSVIPMNGGYVVDADMYDYPEVDSDTGFAYRFKLTDKSTKETSYAFDNGTVIGIFDNDKENKYNVVLNNRAIINKNGPMQLIMPDFYYPGVEMVNGETTVNEGLRAKALASVRTHANKLGGNFLGIIHRLDALEKEGIKRIVGTPFTKDRISSHKYWTENAYQISPEFGSEEKFKTLMTKLFEHDINWIADAALVNEGFCGIHISEVFRKGEDSFSKNMFRTEEIRSLGIIPKNGKYTQMKIVNAPFEITEDGTYKDKNPKYNPAKPTYIQFIDTRLASDEQKKSDSVNRTTTYDNKNTDNIYDITEHDDAVYPFPIEVDPYELQRNAKNLAQGNKKIDLNNIETMKNMSNFSNFNVTTKNSAAGIEVWDGNVDIAKLNFFRCDKDDARFMKLPPAERAEAVADFERGSLAVKDYGINSGKYWSKLTADTLVSSVAEKLSKGNAQTADEYYSLIKKMAGAKSKRQLPASTLKCVDKETVENVINGEYLQRTVDEMDMRADINPDGYGNDYGLADYILRKSMDYPLENLPFNTNLIGVITSPYISKKANIDDELGMSRYDIYKAGNPNLPKKYSKVYNQADKLYAETVVPFITSVLSNVNGISEDSKVSDYGKYVINEIAPDLTKYLFIKALNPKAEIIVTEDGKFDFSKIDESEYTIQALGIPYKGMSLEEESQTVLNLLQKGMGNISQYDIKDLTSKIGKRFENRTLNDYRVAEMIIDRTEAGLGWRIDASKDIAAIDSVRAKVDSTTNAWKNVIDFWKRFNQASLEINRHAFSTAEITDLYDLFTLEGNKTIFDSDADAERKLIEETGITSVANYNYFFSLMPGLYSNYEFQEGDPAWMSAQGKNFELRNKLDTGWSGTNPGFLFQSPEDGVKNSYTFFGNHDKPRALHCLSLDMNLFNETFGTSPEKLALYQKYRQFGENLEEDELKAVGENKDARKKTIKVLENFETASDCLGIPMSQIDDHVNGKAIAMGSRLNTAFEKVLTDNDSIELVKKAVADLASGHFKGREFNPNAFGTRNLPTAIKSVLDEVEYNGGKIPNRAKIEAEVLKDILVPAMDRYDSMYKLLMVLPGSPTDFAGDRLGASGYETKTKNYYQQNRNIIEWEWLADDNYKFIQDHYKTTNEIANLRNNPHLQALNDGDTVTLPIQVLKEKDGKTEIAQNEKIQAILRYNDNQMVIALNDLTGADSPYTERMDRKETKTSTEAGSLENRIVLDPEAAGIKQGLKHGLRIGTEFKNVRNDGLTYKIASMQKGGREYYYLKAEDANGVEQPITIKPEDLNTLILHSV